jgi:O-methyltransferase involved in polyketide biosynthesis
MNKEIACSTQEDEKPNSDRGLPDGGAAKQKPGGSGLSVTALYTCGVWHWGRLPCASLLMTDEAGIAFGATNFTLALAGLFSRRPSLKHSLLHRHLMIDRWLGEKGAVQVIEFAAGLSPRGAAFTANPDIAYTEIDFPEVIEKKKGILARTEEGRSILKRSNLRFVGGDALQVDVAGLADPGLPLLVVAEGLFMYYGAGDQRMIWAKIKEAVSGCRGGGGFIFDLVPTVEQPAPGAVEFHSRRARAKRHTGRSSQHRIFERDAFGAGLGCQAMGSAFRKP